MTGSVDRTGWVLLLLTAALAALAWTWLITWFINTYGNYREEDLEPPQDRTSTENRSNHE